MKKSSLSIALRVLSLLLGIVGVLLIVRSTEMGLAQAESITDSQEDYGAGGRFWLVQQSSMSAYRMLGAILAGVGLFHALRPLSRLEMQRISTSSEQEDELTGIKQTLLPGASKASDLTALRASEPKGPRIDTASRIVSASPQTIYWAFVDPDVLVRWLPPAGMRGRIERFEPQTGGAYRMTLTSTDASGSFEGKSSPDTDIVEGRFTELVPGEKIVQTATFDSPDPSFAGEMVMTWELQPVGDKTKVTVLCEHVPAGIRQSEHEEALSSTLANLERVIG